MMYVGKMGETITTHEPFRKDILSIGVCSFIYGIILRSLIDKCIWGIEPFERNGIEEILDAKILNDQYWHSIYILTYVFVYIWVRIVGAHASVKFSRSEKTLCRRLLRL